MTQLEMLDRLIDRIMMPVVMYDRAAGDVKLAQTIADPILKPAKKKRTGWSKMSKEERSKEMRRRQRVAKANRETRVAKVRRSYKPRIPDATSQPVNGGMEQKAA